MLFSIPFAAVLTFAAYQDQAPGAAGTAVAPFAGDEVVAVARLDLARWDTQGFARRVLGKMADEEDVNVATRVVGDWVEALKKAGAKELFVLVDLTDMPGYPLVVVPLAGGADGKAITRVLTDGVPGFPVRWPGADEIRSAVVAGRPEALAQTRKAKPEAKPDLSAALRAAGDAPVSVVVVPSTTQRRSIEETLPNLPPQVGGGPITTLTRGMRWASLSLTFEPNATARAVVQARDADAAKSLEKVIQTGLDVLGKEVGNNPQVAELSKAIGAIRPRTQGDRITLEADLANAAALVAVPAGQAREAVRRARCMKNLMQIGLAMHNYHDTNDAFPPAFSTAKGGKPLLSWRVLILPFLDQKALYDQFHLDEPWDSDHNKALISRMPPQYACPSGRKSLAAEGKTSYLTPRGPGTIFPGAEKVKIQEIKDGTSNTIFVVDAADDAAVTWTRPDDWEVGTELSPKLLFGHHPGGTNVGFADGSVRFIKETVSPKVLKLILTRDGGEVVKADDF